MKVNILRYLAPLGLTLYMGYNISLASGVDIKPPEITYTVNRVGDRESMIVTVEASDESGIREFRDNKGNLINGNSKTVEFNKRESAIFTAIDNFGNKKDIEIDLNWINPLMKGLDGHIQKGSLYWATSNMREWLNSDSKTVSYTSNPPTNESMNGNGYADEPGFLNEFTEEEKNAIAITERRSVISNTYKEAVEGGDLNMPHANGTEGSILSGCMDKMISEYERYFYKKDLDKVFLLNPNEVYWYMFRRNISFEKELTPEARKIHNRSKYKWWINGNAPWRDFDWGYLAEYNSVVNLSQLRIGQPHENGGVLPSINIKPEYTFKDGRKASDLDIGDKVVFGRYMNAPISWEVINISKTGYPLLISEKILDLKMFDAKGDKNRVYSDYVNYKESDVSMFNIEYRVKNNNSDKDIIKIKLIDESPLMERHNNPYNLSFSVEDVGGSGINKIILPDGREMNATKFDFTVPENGIYVFKAIDNAGNYTEYTLPIGNVNRAPELEVLSKANNEWSNKDVDVEIKSSNEVKYELKDTVLTSKAEFEKSLLPDYVGYGNRAFRIRGKAKLLSYNEKALGQWYGLGFSYKSSSKNDYGYRIDGNWNNKVHLIQIDDMINAPNQEVEFDLEYIIPSNYSHSITPWAQSSLSPSAGECFELELNLTYELIDDSDFSIKSIILPNGIEVNDVKSYTDTIRDEGIHNLRYTVVDNRGKRAEKDVVVKIDKTAPTLDVEYSKNTDTSGIVLNITSEDKLSGFKQINLPGGNIVSNKEVAYTVNENGSYEISAEDVAGNTVKKVLDVQTIDREVTGVSIIKTPEDMTNKDVSISIDVDDYSGVKYIILPNGQKVLKDKIDYSVSTNGKYNFIICDGVDNMKVFEVLVTNIDKNKPSLEISKNPNKEWSNIDVDVSMNGVK